MNKWSRFTQGLGKAAVAVTLTVVMVVALATLVYSGPSAYACPLSGHTTSGVDGAPASS